MARSGTSVGTVVRWDVDRDVGVIESPDLSGDCGVEAGALHPSAGGALRAGQVVEVEWTETGSGAQPFRADRVTPRDDLQATPGG
jgi:cold shock CspA family protein